MALVRAGRRTDDASPYLWSILGRPRSWRPRLGMLAPNAAQRGIDIDGPCYVKPNGWGHLLNAHYLSDIHDCQKVYRRRGGAGGSIPYLLANAGRYPDSQTPRLFSCINGGVPA